MINVSQNRQGSEANYPWFIITKLSNQPTNQPVVTRITVINAH